jgi:hypothetical protein
MIVDGIDIILAAHVMLFLIMVYSMITCIKYAIDAPRCQHGISEEFCLHCELNKNV